MANYSYDSNDIANRIKNTVKSSNIKLKNMLTACDLGINTVSQLTSGKDILSKNLARIADYLGVSVDYLLGRTDNPIVNK